MATNASKDQPQAEPVVDVAPDDAFGQANLAAHTQYEQAQKMLAGIQALVSGLPAIINQTVAQSVNQAMAMRGINLPPPTIEPGMWRALKTDPGHRCGRCNQPNMIYTDNQGNTRAHCHNPNCAYESYPEGPYIDQDGVINNTSRELVPA